MKKHNIKLDGEDCIDCGMLAVTTTEECPSMNTQKKDLATPKDFYFTEIELHSKSIAHIASKSKPELWAEFKGNDALFHSDNFVRAINSHDALMEALKVAIDLTDKWKRTEHGADFEEVDSVLRKALELAGVNV